MKRLILPVLLAILGTAGGVGAGFLLIRPEREPEPAAAVGPCGEVDGAEPSLAGLAAEDPAVPADDPAAPTDGSHEYVRLDNQFVVPIMVDGRVGALVVVSLSVEVLAGRTDLIFSIEPRLRDIFLQELFDHANTGGFEGIFTATANMRILRNALFRAVDQALPGLVTDVLIVDIVRQDN